MSSGFDRLRPRTPAAGRVEAAPADPAGRRVLFSAADAAPVPGTVTLDCSACGQTSVLSLPQAVRAALPSLHLPCLGRSYPSWMRCPACGRRTWLRPRLHL